MNKVKVLIEGYAKINPDGTWDATSTTTLIDTGKHKIIMDPGCHRQLLLKALAKEHLQTGDIDVVFISHYHPDHCTLMGVFENATVYDSVQYQKGPIGGIRSALEFCQEDIFVCSCDMPFVSSDLIKNILQKKIKNKINVVRFG
ncbi:MAG: NTP transferase domain-containing protein, partial [Patescibacteria group bacterium]